MISKDFFASLPKRPIYAAAGVCFAAAVGMVFYTQKYGWEETVVAESLVSFPGARFDRLWFGGDGRLAGARFAGGAIEWQRLNADGDAWETGGRIDGVPGGAPWAMDGGLTRAAWSDGGKICSAPAAGGKAVCETLPVQTTLMGVVMTDAGSAGAVFGDGEFRLWQIGQRGEWPAVPMPLKSADKLAQTADTLAVYSKAEGKVAVFRLDQGSVPKLIGVESAGGAADALMITAPGQVAVQAGEGLRWLGRSFAAPGGLKGAVATPAGSLLAAGDFDGAYELTEDGGNRALLDDAGRLEALAIAESRVAYSGAKSTSVVRLVKAQTMSSRGSMLMRVASFLTSLAVILGLLSSTVGVYSGRLRTKRKRADAPGPPQLPFPTPEMAHALQQRGGILWAGAGLSAQSGFPLWHDFGASLVQSAFYENWVDSMTGTQLMEMVRNHAVDKAVDGVAAQVEPKRHEVAAYYASVFNRQLALSEGHRYLTRLPLVGALTTCYDQLLDSIGADHTILDLSGFEILETEEKGEFFLVKLYGDPRLPSTTIFSKGQFRERCSRKPDLRAAMGALLERRTLVFLGASVEGLVDDLEAIGAPRVQPGAAIRHWAVAGVRGPWEKSAALLRERYAIETVACDGTLIGAQLPQFLEKLGDLCRQEMGQAPAPSEKPRDEVFDSEDEYESGPTASAGD
ncbi:MAG: hypothetical protein R2729_06615 [Bryobacteraceae bacterium]